MNFGMQVKVCSKLYDKSLAKVQIRSPGQEFTHPLIDTQLHEHFKHKHTTSFTAGLYLDESSEVE